jgi:hypothetical protein
MDKAVGQQHVRWRSGRCGGIDVLTMCLCGVRPGSAVSQASRTHLCVAATGVPVSLHTLLRGDPVWFVQRSLCVFVCWHGMAWGYDRAQPEMLLENCCGHCLLCCQSC